MGGLFKAPPFSDALILLVMETNYGLAGGEVGEFAVFDLDDHSFFDGIAGVIEFGCTGNTLVFFNGSQTVADGFAVNFAGIFDGHLEQIYGVVVESSDIVRGVIVFLGEGIDEGFGFVRGDINSVVAYPESAFYIFAAEFDNFFVAPGIGSDEFAFVTKAAGLFSLQGNFGGEVGEKQNFGGWLQRSWSTGP